MPSVTRSWVESLVMSRPSKAMEPEVGGKNPLIRLKKVVLPAPFGPMIAHNSPFATSSDTSRTATRLPNLLVTLLISRTFMPCSVE